MTQREFDLRMNEYRRMEDEEKAPVLEEMNRVSAERKQLGLQMLELGQKMSILKRRMGELAAERRRIGGEYYLAKKKLIIEGHE